MVPLDLKRAYAECAAITRQHARNFYFAFLSLPRPQRSGVYALYAFCREADDIADGAARTEDKGVQMAALRERLRNVFAGLPVSGRDMALADTVRRFGVRAEDLCDVIEGVEMDLRVSRIRTDDELEMYCYHVASAVGLATLPILTNGLPPTDNMRQRAIQLGLGLQLVNILRDVGEDLARDRIYLPMTKLAEQDISERDLSKRTTTPSLRRILETYASRARSYIDEGLRLLPDLPLSGRRCPWLLAAIYGRILDRIVASDYEVFSERVSLPGWEKALLLVSTWWRRL